MPVKVSNNAAARLAASITNAQTTITLDPGNGDMFPQLDESAGDWFPVSVFDAQGNIEVMRCTARMTDVLKVNRGVEGTTPRAFSASDRVELRLTGAIITGLQAEHTKASQTAEANAKKHADDGIKAHNDAADNHKDIRDSLTATKKVADDATTAVGKAQKAVDELGKKLTDTGAGRAPKKNGAMVAGNGDGSFLVESESGSGDTAMANIAFHATGKYGITLGLRADGFFGIGGWSRPAWSWYTDNAGNMYAAGNVTAYSDIRLKTDIERIHDPLEKVRRLCGITFTRIDTGARQTGLIAQHVQSVLPEAVIVGADDEKTLSVAYGNLVGLLVEAIKELEDRIHTIEEGR